MKWTVNPKAIVKVCSALYSEAGSGLPLNSLQSDHINVYLQVDIPSYVPGDVVCITQDIAEAIILQEDHGGLDDKMAEVQSCRQI